MFVTVTELKRDPAKYLALSSKEDVYITRKGAVVAMLSNPFRNRVDMAKSLFGILPADMTLEESREERLGQI